MERRRLSNVAVRAAPVVPLPGQIGAQLLYEREQARHLLRVSQSTLRSMEQAGRLRPVRLSGQPRGKVHYTGANLLENRG